MAVEFKLEKREDIKKLIERFKEVSNAKTPSLDQIRDKAKIQTFLIKESRGKVDFQTLLEFANDDIEKAIDYLITKLSNLNLEVDEKTKEEIEDIEKEIIEENRAELEEVIEETKKEVKKKIKAMTSDSEEFLNQVEQFAKVTDEERAFFRNEFQAIKVVRIEQGGRTFEYKENLNSGTITIRIPSKVKIEIDKDILIKLGINQNQGLNFVEYSSSDEALETAEPNNTNMGSVDTDVDTTKTQEAVLDKIENEIEVEGKAIKEIIKPSSRGRKPAQMNAISKRKSLEEITFDDFISTLKNYGNYFRLLSYMVSVKRFGTYKEIDNYFINMLKDAYKEGKIDKDFLIEYIGKGKKLKLITQE